MLQARRTLHRLWPPALLAQIPLRQRLTAVVGVISLVMFLASATSVVIFVHRTETAAWRGRQQEAALAGAQTVSSFLLRTDDMLAHVGAVSPDNTAEYLNILQDVITFEPEVLEVVRLDDHGAVIGSAHQDQAVLADLFTIPVSQWFLEARDGKTFYGVQISASDQPYLILAVPSSDGGVIAARLRMDILWKVVADVRFGKTGRAYVVSPDGRIVAHTDSTIVLGATDIGEQPELSAVLHAADHTWSGEYVNFAGQPVVGVTTPIGTTGWIMITEMLQDEAYSASRTALVVLGGSMFLFTTLVLVIARSILFHLVLRPIEQLRAGAERFGQGDLDFRIRLNRRDEIGLVARAFNMMAANLRDRERQLASQAESVVTEVTERRQAAAALRQSEARYRAIVEDQTELICRSMADGTLTFVNDAYCRYFGKQREELLGHSSTPLIHDADRANVESQFGALGPKKPVTTYRHRAVRATGTLRWMEWTDRAIFDADGRMIEFQSVGRDITEQRLADEEINRLNGDLERRVAERTEQLASANASLQHEVAERQQAQQILQMFRYSIDQATDAIFWLTPEGGFSYVNERACRSLGYSREELLHQRVWEVDPVFRQERWATVWEHWQARRDSEEDAVETIQQRKDGSTFPVEISTKHFQFGGQELQIAVVRDITEHKRAETALRESEYFLQKSQTVGKIGSYYLDYSTGRWIASPMLDELFGIDDSFVKDIDGWNSLVHPAERAEIRRYFDQHVMAEHHRFDMEYRILRQDDGQECWVHGLGELEFDAQGSPRKMFGTIQDITERKHMEQALRQSEARYRALVENSPDYILVLDTQYRIQYINAVAQGFALEQVIGTNALDYIPSETQGIVRKTLDAVFHDGQPGQYETEGFRRNGAPGWVSTRAVPIYEAGQLTGITLIITDITEYKQQVDSVRLSEARLRDAQAIAHIGNWDWDLVTSELYWSDETYRIFGLVPQESSIDIMTFLEKIHLDDQDRVQQAVFAAILGEPYFADHRIVRPDGEIRYVQQHGQLVVGEIGVPVRMIGTTQDITERKEAEDLIRASLHEKEILLREIHHRVKNNLQIISSLLNLQSDSIANAEVVAQFQDSQDRIRSMALIHERLYRSDSLAYIDFGPYLRDLVSSLVQTYRRQAQGVRLQVDASSTLMDIDTAIPCGLILNELVSNALKHAFPAGAEGVVGVSLCSDAGKYTLVVWDDGIGFPEGIDFRNTASLGLQLVNSLARQLNGTAELYRENGTRFEIIFTGSRNSEKAAYHE